MHFGSKVRIHPIWVRSPAESDLYERYPLPLYLGLGLLEQINATGRLCSCTSPPLGFSEILKTIFYNLEMWQLIDLYLLTKSETSVPCVLEAVALWKPDAAWWWSHLHLHVSASHWIIVLAWPCHTHQLPICCFNYHQKRKKKFHLAIGLRKLFQLCTLGQGLWVFPCLCSIDQRGSNW